MKIDNHQHSDSEIHASAGDWAVDRRDFLMGASLALASACTRAPRDKIIPYARRPEELLPGNPLHYATAMQQQGFATGLLVTSNDGRPTKIEGNPDHPSSLGSTGSFEQALVLELYDPHRAREFKRRGLPVSPRSLLGHVTELATQMDRDGGARLRFLIEPSGGPLKQDLHERIKQRFPQSRFYGHSPVTLDNVYAGARAAVGSSVEPHYSLANAAVIVAIDADLLGTAPSRVRLAREFGTGRQPGAQMNRLYVAECAMTVTGIIADHRLRIRCSDGEALAIALAQQVGQSQSGSRLHALVANIPPPQLAPEQQSWVKAVAKDLQRNSGKCVVIAGERQSAATHALVHALNYSLGNVGKTISYSDRITDDAATSPASLEPLLSEMKAGKVDTLVITAWNPAYSTPEALEFAEAMKRVPNSVYLSLFEDETAQLATAFIPAAHLLESWGDARAHDGTTTIVQPLIDPLFNGLNELELLAAFLGQIDKPPYQQLKDYYRAGSPGFEFERTWESWLVAGIIPGSALPNRTVTIQWDAISRLLPKAASPAQGLEVCFAPDYRTWDGRFGNNPWLQELPDPISKITWDNAALMSPKTAQDFQLKTGDVVQLKYRDRTLDAAVLMSPGHADGSVTLSLGYGRSGSELRAQGVGFNAYVLRDSQRPWCDTGLSVSKTGLKHPFALTQEHWSLEDRDPAREISLAEWIRHPLSSEELPTLHAPVEYEGHKWGMAIDLSRCFGCSACVVACQAENNIPIVGKEQVAKGREMHWLRIDRYYKGELENPTVSTQPLACVHCETAPCEYVCPVNATVHSDEGLNEQIYNRCVGTRYCSNNCPYKVRRFNYLAYTRDFSPTERLAMNPDVTVRSRGVMEKCTYCVQRIERVRINSRIGGKPIRDGDVVTACQAACPTHAIVFGDLNDPRSEVRRLHSQSRRYDLLGELNTRPRTAYLARVRNLNPELG
jgi:molybdopterin-containing oxidoreductase family iron-sulfur binding subunit